MDKVEVWEILVMVSGNEISLEEAHTKLCSVLNLNVKKDNVILTDINTKMTKKEVIRIGTLMGLYFDEKTNYKDALEKGRVVFDGCNGQRFLIESTWDDDKILETIGQSLIQFGKRKKSYEIHQVLSINSD